MTCIPFGVEANVPTMACQAVPTSSPLSPSVALTPYSPTGLLTVPQNWEHQAPEQHGVFPTSFGSLPKAHLLHRAYLDHPT